MGGAEVGVRVLSAGDLPITPRVALPYVIDGELEALMQKQRDEAPYNPRSGLES